MDQGGLRVVNCSQMRSSRVSGESLCLRFGGWLSVSFDKRLEERLGEIQIIHLQLPILDEGYVTFKQKLVFLVLLFILELFSKYFIQILNIF